MVLFKHRPLVVDNITVTWLSVSKIHNRSSGVTYLHTALRVGHCLNLSSAEPCPCSGAAAAFEQQPEPTVTTAAVDAYVDHQAVATHRTQFHERYWVTRSVDRANAALGRPSHDRQRRGAAWPQYGERASPPPRSTRPSGADGSHHHHGPVARSFGSVQTDNHPRTPVHSETSVDADTKPPRLQSNQWTVVIPLKLSNRLTYWCLKSSTPRNKGVLMSNECALDMMSPLNEPVLGQWPVCSEQTETSVQNLKKCKRKLICKRTDEWKRRSWSVFNKVRFTVSRFCHE